jgi:hypothetical protein
MIREIALLSTCLLVNLLLLSKSPDSIRTNLSVLPHQLTEASRLPPRCFTMRRVLVPTLLHPKLRLLLSFLSLCLSSRDLPRQTVSPTPTTVHNRQVYLPQQRAWVHLHPLRAKLLVIPTEWLALLRFVLSSKVRTLLPTASSVASLSSTILHLARLALPGVLLHLAQLYKQPKPRPGSAKTALRLPLPRDIESGKTTLLA